MKLFKVELCGALAKEEAEHNLVSDIKRQIGAVYDQNTSAKSQEI